MYKNGITKVYPSAVLWKSNSSVTFFDGGKQVEISNLRQYPRDVPVVVSVLV